MEIYDQFEFNKNQIAQMQAKIAQLESRNSSPQ